MCSYGVVAVLVVDCLKKLVLMICLITQPAQPLYLLDLPVAFALYVPVSTCREDINWAECRNSVCHGLHKLPHSIHASSACISHSGVV